MKESNLLSIEDVKSIELDILLHIDQYCKENGIRYFLASGTLLGAIRHKGFIPWDDDTDVMMPRPDFEKFIMNYQSDKYILNYPGKPGYYQSICKLADRRTELIQPLPLADAPLGVHVDILPLDGEPESFRLFKRHVKELERAHYYTVFLRCLKFGFTSIRLFLSFIKNLYILSVYIGRGFPWIYNHINTLAMQYGYDESKYVGYITMSRYGFKQRHSKSLFSQSVEVEFEDHLFPAPAGYDEYLHNLFGDYMKLPPKEKRIGQHAWTAYWKV